MKYSGCDNQYSWCTVHTVSHVSVGLKLIAHFDIVSESPTVAFQTLHSLEMQFLQVLLLHKGLRERLQTYHNLVGFTGLSVVYLIMSECYLSSCHLTCGSFSLSNLNRYGQITQNESAGKKPKHFSSAERIEEKTCLTH